MSHKFQPSGMDMAGFRAEPPHVAQQSRREKLRVQPIPPAPEHLLVPYRSADVYDPALLDFSSVQEPSPFANPSAGFQDGAAAGLWKSLAGSQPAYDWITSCTGVGTATPIQASLYPSHVVQRGAGDLSSSQENHKPFGDLHFASPPFCSTPSAGLHENQGMEMASIVQQSTQPWADGGNELLLLPSYATQPANAPRLENTAVWLSRQTPQWTGEEAFVPSKAEDGFGAVPSDGSTKGLSLSLSSNPLPELHVAQFEERFGHEDFAARSDINDVGISGCYPKYGLSGRGYANSIQGSAGCSSSADVRRGAGPLGPFTGYATILKSSKFLKPAQQLMDEFCSAVTGSRLAKQYCDGSVRSSGAVTSAGDATAAENGVVGPREGNSGVSSCSLYSSTEAGGGEGSASDGASQVHRPEFQQKKAKLLYMQEEVCRRYKQYHQQMQMVVSSFESVAGLSAATPYTSLAVKAVSKHFRCLKSAISDQLRHISRVLGEEFMSSPGSSRGDAAATPRLKFIDQSLRRHKSSGDGSSAFTDHVQQQPVWRPQRGLPERSVAVLRAWLFEHFLHPYPTDTDKHMLASQTGLSRNQVSNWFINARVRLWKPMVEEIHMLETKGLTEMDLNSTNKKPGDPLNDGGQPSSDQRSDGQCSKPSDCSSMGSVPNDESYRASIERWHQEKRSRMEECLVPTGVDSGLMSFAAYQGGMDLGGLGAVSLTLGLRHNEGANVVHQQQHMRRHFGGQMLHDFVG